VRALVVGLVCAGWAITMLRHNREKRQALVQLQGHDVDLEYRIGRSRLTERKTGRLYSDESRWYVALRGGKSNMAVPIPSIRQIRDSETGQMFGPWT